MIFAKRFRSADHTKKFVVDEATPNGWQVREEEDNHVVKAAWLHDWHRVERMMLRFSVEGTELERAGWVEEPAA
jgi:hypothetical protein